MADKPASERTEQPTQRHLKKAREKGQLAQSQELPAAISIFVFAGGLFLLSGGLLGWAKELTLKSVTVERSVFSSVKSFDNYFGSLVIDSIGAFFPLLVALCVGSVFASVAVSGLNFAPKAVGLKFNAINPINGFKNLFNMKALMKLFVSIAKIIILSIVVWFYFKDQLSKLAGLRWVWSGDFLAETSKIIFAISVRLGLAILFISLIDVLFQKWKYIEDLKMTRQQVKQENKDTEGSPELKARIRRVQREMAQKRMLDEVPEANVVLVNPTHYAVALKYEGDSMEAPKVLAKGADHLAHRIRDIAGKHGVPIIHKPELTRALYATVEPGGFVPPALYVAVAEVLAMIYRLKGRRNR